MTTLDEISTSAAANREFWTDRARLCLTCYREQTAYGQHAAARLSLSGFRADMQNRRQQTYFGRQA
jgi:hypothetical protein